LATLLIQVNTWNAFVLYIHVSAQGGICSCNYDVVKTLITHGQANKAQE